MKKSQKSSADTGLPPWSSGTGFPSSQAKKQPFNALAVFLPLALLFMVLRLAVLLTNAEAVCDPEELLRGTLAKEWTEGLKRPLWDYQSDDYSAGSLFTGTLAAPLFLLLGPNLLALKLVPLFFSLAALAVFFTLLNKRYGF